MKKYKFQQKKFKVRTTVLPLCICRIFAYELSWKAKVYWKGKKVDLKYVYNLSEAVQLF